VRATNDADRASATVLPACASFSVEPAQNPLANGTRTITAGAYPVIAHILDEGGSEVSPPLVVTGPQVFRFGSGICSGIRLESSALATGADAAYDVTIDPDPAGEWTPASGGARTKIDSAAIVVSNGTSDQIDLLVTKPVWARSLMAVYRTDIVAAQTVQIYLKQPGDGTSLIADGGPQNTSSNNGSKLCCMIAGGLPSGGSPFINNQMNPSLFAFLGLPFVAIRIATNVIAAGKTFRLWLHWSD
jgi:hypothetical protein